MTNILAQNFFELFGLPVSFDVDQQALTSRYRELQRNLHPDRFASASDQERRLSVQMTAHVNEAFQTLKSAAQRARYLLQLKGVEFNEEKDTTVDPAFLMEQMELREALAELRQAQDPAPKLAELMNGINARQTEMVEQLRKLFAANDNESLQQAKQAVQKIRFLNRLQQEAEELEEELLASI